MAFNLIETVQGLFNNELVRKAASQFGESEGGIQKSLGATIPAVLTGLLQKAGSSDGASEILNMAKQALGSGVLSNLGGLLGSQGSGGSSPSINLARGLLGDKLNGVTNLIANYGGIKNTSAASLVNLAAPAAMGAVGKYASDNGLGVAGVGSFLATQKDSILKAIPSGFNIAGALGLGSLGEIGSKLSSMVADAGGKMIGSAGEQAAKLGPKMKWLLPVLLIILAIAFILYLIRGCGGNKVETVPMSDTSTNVAPSANAAAGTRESTKVKLPDGTELNAYKGGVEDQLVNFLNDPNAKAGKDVWFDFDDLNFETGSATITTGSQKQVRNIAAILKAFPKVKIKIGGYTDKSGDSARNQKLSQERADATLAAIKAAGANPNQLVGAEGYGSLFAKADATAPDEERIKDRRIAVSVREK